MVILDESQRKVDAPYRRRAMSQLAMNWRLVLWSCLGCAALFAIIGGTWILFLPQARAGPPKRTRPLIAIIGINDATETTDYLMPYGILRRADVADVVALATGSGPVMLFPALKVEPQATVADFDARHPKGAD
jgi:putative intracellular protease/amidase